MSSPGVAMERRGVEFADVLEYLRPIREYLDSPTISEVMINADLSVFVEEFGRKREVTGCRLNRADISAAVKRIARADNTEPGENNPIINVRLGDGASRICIVLPPASPDGAAISIRKFRPYPFTAEELIQQGSLPRFVFESLAAAIDRSQNILISGGLGSGKTTLLNVLARQVPLTERICLLEYPPEIQLPQRNRVNLQASDDLDCSVSHQESRPSPGCGPHHPGRSARRGSLRFTPCAQSRAARIVRHHSRR